MNEKLIKPALLNGINMEINSLEEKKMHPYISNEKEAFINIALI